MNTLSNYINETLIKEGNTFPLAGAFNTKELIEFAAKFNKFDSKEESDWEGWDNVRVDWEWAMKNKNITKKFCALCKKIESNNHLSYGTIELGNFSLYEWSEAVFNTEGQIYDELGVEGGDYVMMYTSDGDDGMFFQMIATDNASAKLIDEFVKMTHDPSGWDVEVMEIPDKSSFDEE